MILRPVSPADVWFLHELRNDPDTLAASRNTQPVTMNDHVAWFNSTPDQIFIAEESTGKIKCGACEARRTMTIRLHPHMWTKDCETYIHDRVGTIRFIRHPHEIELSITVAPAYRGKGFASRMLVLAVAENTGPLPLVAYVRLHNSRSHAAFDKAGWVNDGYYTRYEAVSSLQEGNSPSHE